MPFYHRHTPLKNLCLTDLQEEFNSPVMSGCTNLFQCCFGGQGIKFGIHWVEVVEVSNVKAILKGQKKKAISHFLEYL